ncbi:MAG: GNVR domain-containing protein [Solirubrobacterales bacterium]
MATDGGQGSSVKTVHDLGVVEALRALRPQLWLVLAVSVGVAALAAGLSLLQEKEYTASSTLYSRTAASVVLIHGPKLDAKGYQSALIAPRLEPEREATTTGRLASLDLVSDRVAKRIDGGLSGEELSSMLEVNPVLESDIIEFQATAPRPALAARLANAYGREYERFRHSRDRAAVKRATRVVVRQLRGLPARRLAERFLGSPRRQLDTLRTVTALQSGNVDFIERAEVPSSPSSPKPARAAALGLGLGILLGIALGLIRERISTRSKTERAVPEPIVDRVAPRGNR